MLEPLVISTPPLNGVINIGVRFFQLTPVRELFKQGRIHIHPTCTNLIWELETYAYPEKKPNQNEKETPIKENDHALDEIRYAIYMQELESAPFANNILNQLPQEDFGGFY